MAALEELGVNIVDSDSDVDSNEELLDVSTVFPAHADKGVDVKITEKHPNKDIPEQRTDVSGRTDLFTSKPDRMDKERTELVPDSQFLPSHDLLLTLLRENYLNWFGLVASLKLTFPHFSQETHDHILLDFGSYLTDSDLTAQEENVAEQSRQAFLAFQRDRMMNNSNEESEDEIVSECESDNPEDWVQLKDRSVLSDEVAQKVKKHIGIFQRKKRDKLQRLFPLNAY